MHIQIWANNNLTKNLQLVKLLYWLCIIFHLTYVITSIIDIQIPNLQVYAYKHKLIILDEISLQYLLCICITFYIISYLLHTFAVFKQRHPHILPDHARPSTNDSIRLLPHNDRVTYRKYV